MIIKNWVMEYTRTPQECLLSIIDPETPCPICGKATAPNRRGYHPGPLHELWGTFDCDNPHIEMGTKVVLPFETPVTEVVVNDMEMTASPLVFSYSFVGSLFVGHPNVAPESP